MSEQETISRTLLSYRTFELVGAFITIVAIGVSVYVYLESLRRSMDILQEDIRETMQTVVSSVNMAYHREEQRDADWLKINTDDTKNILIKIDETEAGLIEYIGTGRDDEAWQRGLHEGHHQALSRQLTRLEKLLIQLQ